MILPPRHPPKDATAADHARTRARQRFGYQLDKKALAGIRDRIIHARWEGVEDCVLLHTQKDGREIWAVWKGAEWIPVVFEPRTRFIITFLPALVLRRNRSKLPW